jgi:DNA-binding XRE family transcriptional regulator
VREIRLARGLSQKELAGRAGITRQAVNAVEMRRYTPNAAVALRLAQALDAHVEDLFSLPFEAPDRPVRTTGEALVAGERVAVAQVGDVLVAHPLMGMSSIIEGFQPADAIASADGASVKMLAPPDAPGKTAVLLGCDPSLTVLVSWVARSLPQGRLLWLHASSQSALDALPRGLAHVAGSHLPGDTEANVGPARRAVGRGGGLVVTYAAWEQGLIVAHGNPKALCSAADLARPGVRIVNREPGSGSRKLLDELMARDGLAPADVADTPGCAIAWRGARSRGGNLRRWHRPGGGLAVLRTGLRATDRGAVRPRDPGRAFLAPRDTGDARSTSGCEAAHGPRGAAGVQHITNGKRCRQDQGGLRAGEENL